MIKFDSFKIGIRNELDRDVHFPSNNVGFDGFYIIVAAVKNASITISKLLVVPEFMNEFV